MPEESRLAMYPLFEDEDLVLIRQCLLANGTPVPILSPKRKLHDQNPMWIAFSFDCRRAVENGCPQVLPFVVPIIPHLLGLMDVAPREQLLNWVTGLFGFALLQLVVKGLPEAKALGRMDVNKRGNKGLYVLSTETLEKILASTSELAVAMADCEAKYLGIFADQNVEHTFGGWAEAANGDLSMVNIARCVGAAVGQRAITHLLGLDAAKRGRVSELHSGSFLKRVDRIDFEQVWTIGQAVEAGFEMIELCFPGREPEWPSVFGDRGSFRAFASMDDLLRWLPQPKPRVHKRIVSTEQLGYTTATAWTHQRHAQQQHAVFAGHEQTSPEPAHGGEAVEYAEDGEAEVDADGVDAAQDREGEEVELTDDFAETGEGDDAPQVDDTAEAEEDEDDGDT